MSAKPGFSALPPLRNESRSHLPPNPTVNTLLLLGSMEIGKMNSIKKSLKTISPLKMRPGRFHGPTPSIPALSEDESTPNYLYSFRVPLSMSEFGEDYDDEFEEDSDDSEEEEIDMPNDDSNERDSLQNGLWELYEQDELSELEDRRLDGMEVLEIDVSEEQNLRIDDALSYVTDIFCGNPPSSRTSSTQSTSTSRNSSRSSPRPPSSLNRNSNRQETYASGNHSGLNSSRTPTSSRTRRMLIPRNL